MDGLSLALQTLASLRQQRGKAYGGEVAARDAKPEEDSDTRAVHDAENQAAQQPDGEEERPGFLSRYVSVLHAPRLALQCCTPTNFR
jgi:hypothetical protein